MQIPLPLGFSPSAAHKLAHPDGEIATSRAVAKAGLPMILATYSSTLLEDVAAQGAGNPYAMCMSMLLNRNQTIQILRRVESTYLNPFTRLETSISRELISNLYYV